MKVIFVFIQLTSSAETAVDENVILANDHGQSPLDICLVTNSINELDSEPNANQSKDIGYRGDLVAITSEESVPNIFTDTDLNELGEHFISYDEQSDVSNEENVGKMVLDDIIISVV